MTESVLLDRGIKIRVGANFMSGADDAWLVGTNEYLREMFPGFEPVDFVANDHGPFAESQVSGRVVRIAEIGFEPPVVLWREEAPMDAGPDGGGQPSFVGPPAYLFIIESNDVG